MGVALNFILHGQAVEVISAYAEAFGAQPEVFLRYSDANPADQSGVPEAMLSRVYHAEMTILGQRAMFSDMLDDGPVPVGGTLCAVALFDDGQGVVRAYRALRDGAAIVHPLHMSTYSACTVSLIDRFGVRWTLMTERPPAYAIRRAGAADARAVAEVLAHTWGETYRGMLAEEFVARQTDVEVRLSRIAPRIADAGNITLLMEKDGAACGMAGLLPREGEDGAVELQAFYVRKAEWGAGAGRYLMDHALAAARAAGYRAMKLMTLVDNVRARAFYARCGFAEVGEEVTDFPATDGASGAVAVRFERVL